MCGVDCDRCGLDEDGGTVVAADENVRVGAVAEGFYDVRGGEEVALAVDEEAIAEETVTVAVGGGGFVELIDDGADGGGERSVVSRGLGSSRGYEGDAEAGKQDHKFGSVSWGAVGHWAG